MKTIIRPVLLIISIIAMSINLFAQKPDFAYPQTVSKTAKADLEKALKNNDAHAALNALIRYYISNTLIDQASQPECIKLAEQTSEKFRDNQLSGIFFALQAKLYLSYYQSNKWTFDRRELPLMPVPKDISEWSGAIFKAKINELNIEACSKPTTLNNLPISDYSDIISADSLTVIYYPTLLDFVCSQAAYNSSQIDINEKSFYEIGKTHSTKTLIWDAMICQKADNTQNAQKKLKALYQSNIENPQSAIALVKFIQSLNDFVGYDVYDDDYDYDDDDESQEANSNKAYDYRQERWAIKQIDQYAIRFPKSIMLNQLLYLKSNLLRTIVNLQYPDFVAPGQNFDIKINNYCASKLKIKLYQLPPSYQDSYIHSDAPIFKKAAIKEIELNYDDKLPFRQIDTLSIAIDKAGLYVLMPFVEGMIANSSSMQIITCCDRIPAVFTSANTNYAIVADAITGAPIAGQNIIVTYDNKRYNAPATDARGISDITNALDRTKYDRGYIVLPTPSGDIKFNRLYASLEHNSDTSDKNYAANVLTDRAIYRPGDKIQVLAIVSWHRNVKGKFEHQLQDSLMVEAVLRDANYQEVKTVKGKTDKYGRFTAEFETPAEGLTGRFDITIRSTQKGRYLGSKSVMVSEYKMPDFELIELNSARNVPAKGDVTLSGKAQMYNGMPLANAEITATVSESSFWRWYAPNNKIWSGETTTDIDGNFSIVVPDSILKASEWSSWFTAQLDANSPSGTTTTAMLPFNIGKEFTIYISGIADNIDGEKPFMPSITSYGADGKEAPLEMRWSISQNDKKMMEGAVDGKAIDISHLIPGNYTFTVSAYDKELADDTSDMFVVYNRASGIVPGNDALWFEKTEIEALNSKALIPYGATSDCYVYYALGVSDKIIDIQQIKVAKGYHDLALNLPANLSEGRLSLIVVKDSKPYTYDINITHRQDNHLTIVAESFRDHLTPLSSETWKFKIADAQGKPVEAAVALDMYNKALDALYQQNFSLAFTQWRQYPTMSLRSVYPKICNTHYSELIKDISYEELEPPYFYFYGYDNYYDSRNIRVSGLRYSMRKSANVMYELAAPSMAANCLDDECVVEEEAISLNGAAIADEAKAGEAGVDNKSADTFDFRDAATPLSIWHPRLATDKDGNITYTFDVPNAISSWRLLCIAWTKDMEVGNLIREVVTSKPIMVQANMPRFLRVGDKAVISALLMNNSETTDTISTKIEIFNPLTNEIIASSTVNQSIPAKQSAIANIELTAPGDLSVIGYRVKSTMGNFSDGEQSLVPILSSMAQVIETDPFYLNPGDTNYTTTLPAGKDARLSLTFSENPAWSIVSALPGLRTQISDYANSASAALFSAAVAKGIMDANPNIALAIKEWIENPSDSALISMLQKNEDLKIALLNSTPWVEAAMDDTDRMARFANIFDNKAIRKSIDKAISILQDLQRHDGGWAWGKWCDQSSVWVTSNVLEMMADLKKAGWLPKSKDLEAMIVKALKFYDKEVSKLHPGQKKLSPDLLYTILRPQFTETPIADRGNDVIAITLSDIEKHWKKYDAPGYKAMAALALYNNQRIEKAHQVLSSLSEFAVSTPSQGVKFPNENSPAAYGIILEAYATIQPHSKMIDGLRQQLIVRKQGTDWGDAVVTTQVVAGILSCGSNWTVSAQGATIIAGDKPIVPSNNIEKYTGNIKADLSPYAGEQLHIITPGVGPAYGAVYAQYKEVMDHVEPYACDDLSIVKQMTVRRGTGWEMLPDTLQVGDRVKIQLTIHCKRNLDYVTIIDERAACFEPVDQIPGWLWSENCGFYRENRDASTNLFVVSLRPGTYLLTYEMNVSMAGAFSSGVATIQSQYAPEISAHSQGNRINATNN